MASWVLGRLLTGTLILIGCLRAPEATIQADPPAPSLPAGTTKLPRLGGRKIAPYRCRVDLATAKTEVDSPKDLEKDEEAVWNDLSDQISREGRTFRVLMEDNKNKKKGGIPSFPDWVRVSISEIDNTTKKIIRTIPIQEFQGEHEEHGVRALILKDGKIRFWVQFWVND